MSTAAMDAVRRPLPAGVESEVRRWQVRELALRIPREGASRCAVRTTVQHPSES